MPDKFLPSGPPLTRKKYTPAFKAECVRQVAAGSRQTDVARAQNLSPALLGRWQRQALAEAVPNNAESEEIKRLCAELKRVEQERDILKSRDHFCADAPVMSRYQFIEQVATTASVQVLLRVLHVSPAGYYQWRSQATRPMPSWEPAATAAFSRYAQRYGTRRLRAEGHADGRYALRTWLRRRGLRELSTRPQRPRTTVADPAAVVAENLLFGQSAPTAPNQVWVGDIVVV